METSPGYEAGQDEVLATIPSVDFPPEEWEPSETVRAIYGRAKSRRAFVKGLVVAGIGLSLNILGAIPPFRARRASASAYDTWWNCSPAQYWTPGTVCTPSTAYYGSDTCDGNSWHRWEYIGEWDWGTSYYHHPTRCYDKNAWHWTVGTYGNGFTRKCSDGDIWWWGWWGNYGTTSLCTTDYWL